MFKTRDYNNPIGESQAELHLLHSVWSWERWVGASSLQPRVWAKIHRELVTCNRSWSGIHTWKKYIPGKQRYSSIAGIVLDLFIWPPGSYLGMALPLVGSRHGKVLRRTPVRISIADGMLMDPDWAPAKTPLDITRHYFLGKFSIQAIRLPVSGCRIWQPWFLGPNSGCLDGYLLHGRQILKPILKWTCR